LNVDGFFDPLLTWIERSFAEGFISPKYRDLVLVSTNPEELVARLVSP
jgi:predicted Rossmann-fold nucleotide-binding protein